MYLIWGCGGDGRIGTVHLDKHMPTPPSPDSQPSCAARHAFTTSVVSAPRDNTIGTHALYSVAAKTTPRGFEPLRAEPNGFRVHLLNRSDTLSYGYRKHWLVLGSFVAASAWQAVALRGFVSRTLCDAALRLEHANQGAKTWQHLKFSKPVTHLCIKAST